MPSSRLRTYRLPFPPYENCVTHKELIEYLGFKDSSTQEARHIFDTKVREICRRAGFRFPDGIPGHLVLSGEGVMTFNDGVYSDHAFRFPVTKVRVYTAEGVAFVLAGLQGTEGTSQDDRDLLLRLSPLNGKSGIEHYQAYQRTLQTQQTLFMKTRKQPKVAKPKAARVSAPQPAAIPAPTTTVVSPVATLSAVMVALHEWVKNGKLTSDLADRYLVDYMQRNGVLDFTQEPPALPPGLSGGLFHQTTSPAPVVSAPQPPPPPAPAPTTNGNGHANGHGLPPKFSARGPYNSPLDIYRECLAKHNIVDLSRVGIQSQVGIEELAKRLGLFERAFWGRMSPTKEWHYDADARDRIMVKVDQIIRSNGTVASATV